jgi:hypothetical protein
VKRQEREAGHSPFSAEVRKGGAVPPFRHMSSWLRAELSTGTTLINLILMYNGIPLWDPDWFFINKINIFR